MTYGVFSDEGLLEGGFADAASATRVLAELYAEEDGAFVAEICPDHEESPRDGCEDCDGDE